MRILLRTVTGTTSALLSSFRGRRFSTTRSNVVVIMGATGTGKSKLSIDVAERFPAEVVNADKIQVYRGLDITTNKMSADERRGVPHHLLGELDPAAGELHASQFRSLAANAIAGIISRRRLPVLAGGSNSFLHALLTERYESQFDPFTGVLRRQQRLRYNCCFLWVDVDEGVLMEQLDRRVDDMVGLGMVEELKRYFAKEVAERHPGLAKAIGVPELKSYFTGDVAYEGAMREIKDNTRQLAAVQVGKIKRLAEMGWPMKRLDATQVVKARLNGAGKAAEGKAWERDVAGPAMDAIGRFLEVESHQAVFPLAVGSTGDAEQTPVE